MNVLENAVFNIAKKLVKNWRVSSDAPNSYEALKKDYAIKGIITVYDGGCDKTIYSTPELNHAFRAWHDYTHLKHDLDFSRRGEFSVCDIQLDLLRVYNVPDYYLNIFEADIKGQILYYNKHKKFVDNQIKFVLDYVHDPVNTLLKEY